MQCWQNNWWPSPFNDKSGFLRHHPARQKSEQHASRRQAGRQVVLMPDFKVQQMRGSQHHEKHSCRGCTALSRYLCSKAHRLQHKNRQTSPHCWQRAGGSTASTAGLLLCRQSSCRQSSFGSSLVRCLNVRCAGGKHHELVVGNIPTHLLGCIQQYYISCTAQQRSHLAQVSQCYGR